MSETGDEITNEVNTHLMAFKLPDNELEELIVESLALF